MADHAPPMSPAEISILKETLCAQQHLLHKLSAELDAEREASATAASEALSVILRLQGEKAAVKMEAEQYKRLAEQKMCHAEESFTIIEDIIYQKEMEVAALDHQVQSYRHKLLTMGCADPAPPSPTDFKSPENLLQRSRDHVGLGRRINSAPVLPKLKKTVSPEPDPPGPETGEEIRRLDILVRKITGRNYTGPSSEARSPSSLTPSRFSAGNMLCYLSGSGFPEPGTRAPSPFFMRSPYNSGKTPSQPCSPNVHDVFEVPQAEPADVSSNGLLEPEPVKISEKHEPDWLKKLLQQPTVDEKGPCELSQVAAADRDVVGPTGCASGSVVEARPGSNLGVLREEEMELLREIKEEIYLLKDEIRIGKGKKTTMQHSKCPLPEAMLHFWL